MKELEKLMKPPATDAPTDAPVPTTEQQGGRKKTQKKNKKEKIKKKKIKKKKNTKKKI